MESCAVFENNMHSAKRTKSWSRDRLVHLDRSLDVALSATKCRVGESDFGSSTNGRAPVYPRLARDRHLQRTRRSTGKMEGDEPT